MQPVVRSPAVEVGGALHEVPQGNNAFIFPGLGLGALAAGVETIPESLVLRAAQALATYTSHVGEGEALFLQPPSLWQSPRLSRLR